MTFHRRSRAVNDVALAIELVYQSAPSFLPDPRRHPDFETGTFASSKKGGDLIGPTKRGKGYKLLLVDGSGPPFDSGIDSALAAEVTLIETLLDRAVKRYVPIRLIYDSAANSDRLRERLQAGTSSSSVPIAITACKPPRRIACQ